MTRPSFGLLQFGHLNASSVRDKCRRLTIKFSERTRHSWLVGEASWLRMDVQSSWRTFHLTGFLQLNFPICQAIQRLPCSRNGSGELPDAVGRNVGWRSQRLPESLDWLCELVRQDKPAFDQSAIGRAESRRQGGLSPKAASTYRRRSNATTRRGAPATSA